MKKNMENPDGMSNINKLGNPVIDTETATAINIKYDKMNLFSSFLVFLGNFDFI